jgi:hypothetical protein
MEEIRIQDWEQLVSVARGHDGWAFRGQREASWALESSLSRYLRAFVAQRDEWSAREQRAVRIFRRKAHNFLQEKELLNDDLRCLALMQHHGAPTRMLDFTKSPYVAVFFAVEAASGDSSLFALNTPALFNAAPKRHPSLLRGRIDPREPGNLTKYFLGNRHPVLWIGEPERMDRRLVAQSGTFVVPGTLHQTLDELVTSYACGSEPLIKKFVLPQSLRREAMESLYRMNITHATLFPDLEGLAKACGFELEVVWRGLPPQPRVRRVLTRP